jgi:hypothetical protein
MNDESRIPNDEQTAGVGFLAAFSVSHFAGLCDFRHSSFVILSSFVIGHSSFLPGFLMRRVLSLFAAELLQFDAVRAARFFLRSVIARAADRAFQPDVFTHE